MAVTSAATSWRLASALLKLLVCNMLEAGKSVICLDPEHEMGDLCANLGGCEFTFRPLAHGVQSQQYFLNQFSGIQRILLCIVILVGFLYISTPLS